VALAPATGRKFRYWTWYGLMQAGHVKALLKMAGYKIRAENMGLGDLLTRTCTSTKSIPQ
jgi:hypothetical protein